MVEDERGGMVIEELAETTGLEAVPVYVIRAMGVVVVVGVVRGTLFPNEMVDISKNNGGTKLSPRFCGSDCVWNRH